MSKAYTFDQLSANLVADRNWRIKELSDLKLAIRRSDEVARAVLLRALVAIAYAHWEGYVRFAATKYFEYITIREPKYGDLQRQFRRNLFAPRILKFKRSPPGFKQVMSLIDEIIDCDEKRFSKINDDLVNTKSNLSSEVMEEICIVCGVDPQLFLDENNFIDIILLKRRNGVAHGEVVTVEFSEVDDIADRTINLMRSFGDLLENHAALELYRAA